MIYFILSMVLILIIVVTLRKIRPSTMLQFLTHVLLYMIEIISVTTFLNFIIKKYEIVSIDSSLLNTLKNYVFAYTVYQLLLLVTFKLKDSLNGDAYTSMKNEIDRCQIWAEFGKKIPDEYIEKFGKIISTPGVAYNKKQRDYFNKILRVIEKYNSNEIIVTDFRCYLKQQSIQFDYEIKLINFSWMNSILLRFTK